MWCFSLWHVCNGVNFLSSFFIVHDWCCFAASLLSSRLYCPTLPSNLWVISAFFFLYGRKYIIEMLKRRMMSIEKGKKERKRESYVTVVLSGESEIYLDKKGTSGKHAVIISSLHQNYTCRSCTSSHIYHSPHADLSSLQCPALLFFFPDSS